MNARHRFNDHTVSKEESSCNYATIKKNVSSMTDIDKICPHKNAPNNETASNTRKKKRCNVCMKKVSIVTFPCRCGGIYCGKCRYAETHSCTYDYTNDKVDVEGCVSLKIEKI